MPEWDRVKLGEVLIQDQAYVAEPEPRLYPKFSVKLYGRGVVVDTPVRGDELKMKRHQIARAGQVVLSEIWGKKGAIGLVPEVGEGALCTSHFFLFDIIEERVLPDWLSFVFKANYLEDQLGAGAQGTTGYAAVRPKHLLAAEIPLPPLPEQWRIVARVKGLLEKVEEARSTGAVVAAISEQFVVALHASLAGDRIARVGDFLELDERKTLIEEGHQYPQVGVRSFGKGLFARETLDASQTSYKQFHRLYSGAVVLSQVKGWEGAIGVCPESLVDRYASPEFRTFRCVGKEASPEYLAVLVRTEWFWNKLKDATRGVGARRERTRPEQFLNIQLPMPPLAEQERAVRILKKLHTASEQRKAYQPELDALPSAILARAFAGAL